MTGEQVHKKRGVLTHERYVNIIGKLLIIFPGAYVLMIGVVPPLLLGAVMESPSIAVVALVAHIVSLLVIPGYLFVWRVLSYGGRMLYTMLLHRFLFHISQSRGFKTMYADLSGVHSVETFYQQKTRSIRRRMTRSIPEKIAKAGVEVQCLSSNRIGIAHLKIQYAHSRKYASSVFGLYMLVLGFFSLVGSLTEYRIQGKLVGQGLGFLRGESYTIYQYGALDEVARIGLWFYNIAEHIRHAIALQTTFVNGTLEIHKPEAKFRAGFVATNEEELVSCLYGGNFTNIPHEGHGTCTRSLFV
jgi:hypothetical protein